MAVRTSNFEIAALDADKPQADAEENLAEIVLNGKFITLWRRPSPGQFGMLQLRLGRGDVQEIMHGLDRFLAALMLDEDEAVANDRTDVDGVKYADRVANGEEIVGVDWVWDLYEKDVLKDDDLIDLLRKSMEIHSGFPTEPSSASSPSRKTSGRPSTATSRRVKSTPSS